MSAEPNDTSQVAAESGQLAARIISSRYHAGYWRRRIYHKTKRVGGQLIISSDWSVRLQHGGRRESFALRTADAKDAAVKAREISAFLEVNGWEATIARYKRKGGADAGPVTTVEQFLAAVRLRATQEASTVRLYIDSLRYIVAGIAGLRGGLERYDYVNGGSQAWQKAIGAQRLSILSQESVKQWRTRYVLRAGVNPVKRKSAERTASSKIRNARALFSPHFTEGIGLAGNPFAEVKISSPRPERYRSVVDPAEIMQSARIELQDAHPQQFLALLLCLWGGLRRKEADVLLAAQLDFEGRQIKIYRTAFFSPKTAESQRDVDVPAAIMAMIRALVPAKQQFALQGLEPKLDVNYSRYRAEATWADLIEWLRRKGITEKKAIHSLRKESGSLVVQHHGIEQARAHLGHAGIDTTSAHYVAKKGRREVVI